VCLIRFNQICSAAKLIAIQYQDKGNWTLMNAEKADQAKNHRVLTQKLDFWLISVHQI